MMNAQNIAVPAPKHPKYDVDRSERHHFEIHRCSFRTSVIDRYFVESYQATLERASQTVPPDFPVLVQGVAELDDYDTMGLN